MIGVKKYKEIENVIINGLVVVFLIGIVMSIIFIFMLKNFLIWMGIDFYLV